VQFDVSIVTSAKPSVWTFLSPAALLRSIIAPRYLILQLAWREVRARYHGTYLGILWSFLNPLLLLVVYTYVFSVLLGAKWGTNPDHFAFALTLFAGLIAFSVFSEVVGRAPALVLSNPNYVKRVVFPLEILPVVALTAVLVQSLMTLVILVAAKVVLQGALTPHVLLFPLTLLPVALLALGIGWFLASLGVFVRDIGPVVALAVQVLMFVTPIFYPLEVPLRILPDPLKFILISNPLTVSVESFRDVVLRGASPNWLELGSAAIVGLVCCQLGFAFFMRTKKAFADVI